MSYDGRAVANFILDFCDLKQRKVTNLALQKIIYFCHARFLADRNKPLVKHQFEAWQFGPVLQYVYRDFKMYDASPIASRAKGIDLLTGRIEIVGYDFDKSTKQFLESIVDFYSRLSASDLVDMSHATGGPWDQAWNHRGRVNPGMRIDNAAIQRYYSEVQAPFSLQ